MKLRFLSNGHDIKKYDVDDLRQTIGLVNQEPVWFIHFFVAWLCKDFDFYWQILFATSIKDNISYGKDHSTKEEIVEAAKQANAHEFIMKLPQVIVVFFTYF